MPLRIYPISAARWAQLAGTPSPIDLTERTVDTGDRADRFRDEHAALQVQVAALLAEHVSASA
ncbi:MAG: hypothetical protein ACLPVY_20500 [Acidimicrobiia bacterium]